MNVKIPVANVGFITTASLKKLSQGDCNNGWQLAVSAATGNMYTFKTMTDCIEIPAANLGFMAMAHWKKSTFFELAVVENPRFTVRICDSFSDINISSLAATLPFLIIGCLIWGQLIAVTDTWTQPQICHFNFMQRYKHFSGHIAIAGCPSVCLSDVRLSIAGCTLTMHVVKHSWIILKLDGRARHICHMWRWFCSFRVWRFINHLLTYLPWWSTC